jgi:hypothetical protein
METDEKQLGDLREVIFAQFGEEKLDKVDYACVLIAAGRRVPQLSIPVLLQVHQHAYEILCKDRYDGGGNTNGSTSVQSYLS